MIGSRSNIRSKRRSSRWFFLLLLLLSAMIYFSARGNDDAFKNSRSEVEGIGANILQYLTLPFRGFENFSGDIKDRFSAHSQNKELKAQLVRLSDVEARANALAVKLAGFEKILNVDTGSGIPETKIAARAVSEIDGPFLRTALINAGQKDGVSEGDAVMTVNGLYGHVIRAGRGSSRVLRLEDLNSRIAVMSKEAQSRAILTGNNSPLPALSFMTGRTKWEDGDEVITSGDDGILPAGLPVGTAIIDENGKAVVNLFASRNFVDWVWIYPYDKILPPEDDLPEETEPESEFELETADPNEPAEDTP